MTNQQIAIYMMSNKKNGCIYTGVTTHLTKRIGEHKGKVVKSFTHKYNCDKLVYFELYDNLYNARQRESQIKAGSRKKKIALIEKENPEWNDLSYLL